MIISMMWAQSSNGVIGDNNQIPWHIPDDLKYFKLVTSRKPVIMGRKTFESLGMPLPNRPNIVVSRQQDYSHHAVMVVHNIEDAIKHAKALTAKEAIVIGGAEIYEQAMPLATRLYVTLIDKDVAGDTYFPKFDHSEWIVTSELPMKHGDLSYKFQTMVRA